MSNKNNIKVTILIGAPSSGKSTWSKEFLQKNPNWVRVSRDDFRFMLRNQPMTEPKVEELITEMQDKMIIYSLSKRLNVLIDNTNLKQKYINHFIELCTPYADVDYHVFDVPLKTCLERDAQREKSVGSKVLERMYKDFEILKDSFHFQPANKLRTRKTIVPDFKSELPQAIIVDIDGTLTTGPHQNRSPYDWDKVHLDTPNQIVIEQTKFHRSLGRKVLITSGRDEQCRKLTTEWLDFYGVEYDELFMRPHDNMQKDTLIKREIYNSKIKGVYNVLCVLDDRLSVLEMWNDLGLFTFNVNQYQQIF